MIIASGGLIMYLLNHYFTNTIYTFMLPMFLTTIGIGMIRPTASAGAMQAAPHKIAGSASAFFNFISFVSSSIATTLTALFISQVAGFGLFIVLVGIAALVYQKLA